MATGILGRYSWGLALTKHSQAPAAARSRAASTENPRGRRQGRRGQAETALGSASLAATSGLRTGCWFWRARNNNPCLFLHVSTHARQSRLFSLLSQSASLQRCPTWRPRPHRRPDAGADQGHAHVRPATPLLAMGCFGRQPPLCNVYIQPVLGFPLACSLSPSSASPVTRVSLLQSLSFCLDGILPGAFFPSSLSLAISSRLSQAHSLQLDHHHLTCA